MIGISEDVIQAGIVAANIKEVDADAKNFKDNLYAELKKIHELTEKSIRAFHMSNDKENYTLVKFNSIIDARKNRMSETSVDSAKNFMIHKIHSFAKEIEKHIASPNVYHDNGKVWKKNTQDRTRFFQLQTSVENLTKIVS